MSDKERLDENIFECTTEISMPEYKSDSKRWGYETESHMREKLADHLVKIKVKTDIYDFHVAKTLRVYVGTPEEFWELVQKEARKIACYL